ncbi:MAG: alpha/beta fold hydrolase, partial [Paracoccaceae bacterium]
PPGLQAYMTARINLIPAQIDVLMDDAAGLLSYMRLESLGIPVLLLEGAESPPIIAAIQTELARRLPQATRTTIPGAGHMLPITHRTEVSAAIAAHLHGTSSMM